MLPPRLEKLAPRWACVGAWRSDDERLTCTGLSRSDDVREIEALALPMLMMLGSLPGGCSDISLWYELRRTGSIEMLDISDECTMSSAGMMSDSFCHHPSVRPTAKAQRQSITR